MARVLDWRPLSALARIAIVLLLIPLPMAQVASTITENYARGTLEGLILWATASRSQPTRVVDTLRSVGLTEQADALAGQLNRLDPANPENMVSQLGRLRDGTAQLRYNLTSPDAPYLSGVNQHGDGSSQLADGSTELRVGTERL